MKQTPLIASLLEMIVKLSPKHNWLVCLFFSHIIPSGYPSFALQWFQIALGKSSISSILAGEIRLDVRHQPMAYFPTKCHCCCQCALLSEVQRSLQLQCFIWTPSAFSESLDVDSPFGYTPLASLKFNSSQTACFLKQLQAHFSVPLPLLTPWWLQVKAESVTTWNHSCLSIFKWPYFKLLFILQYEMMERFCSLDLILLYEYMILTQYIFRQKVWGKYCVLEN